MIENQIRYYSACYQADFRAINLVNFFSAKVEQGLILEEASILEGKLIQYPLPTEWAENALKEFILDLK